MNRTKLTIIVVTIITIIAVVFVLWLSSENHTKNEHHETDDIEQVNIETEDNESEDEKQEEIENNDTDKTKQDTDQNIEPETDYAGTWEGVDNQGIYSKITFTPSNQHEEFDGTVTTMGDGIENHDVLTGFYRIIPTTENEPFTINLYDENGGQVGLLQYFTFINKNKIMLSDSRRGFAYLVREGTTRDNSLAEERLIQFLILHQAEYRKEYPNYISTDVTGDIDILLDATGVESFLVHFIRDSDERIGQKVARVSIKQEYSSLTFVIYIDGEDGKILDVDIRGS